MYFYINISKKNIWKKKNFNLFLFLDLKYLYKLIKYQIINLFFINILYK